jgi:hypothetical protein
MKISPERKRGIQFHVKNDDYFGTLATVLDLFRQTLGTTGRERHIATSLEKLTADLIYLQKEYKIEPKLRRKRKVRRV